VRAPDYVSLVVLSPRSHLVRGSFFSLVVYPAVKYMLGLVLTNSDSLNRKST